MRGENGDYNTFAKEIGRRKIMWKKIILYGIINGVLFGSQHQSVK